MDAVVRIAQQPEADALLARSPLALLTGALLDRNIPTEWAFAGPLAIIRRLGWDDLDAHKVVGLGPRYLTTVLATRPAVHDCPTAMARRMQELCRHLVARYGGEAAGVWEGAATGRALVRRVNELPGFGRQKSQILVALLGKQFGIRPDGWREAAGPYGEHGVLRSVADVTGPESLERVREFRCEHRRAVRQAGAAARSGTGTAGHAR